MAGRLPLPPAVIRRQGQANVFGAGHGVAPAVQGPVGTYAPAPRKSCLGWMRLALTPRFPSPAFNADGSLAAYLATMTDVGQPVHLFFDAAALDPAMLAPPPPGIPICSVSARCGLQGDLSGQATPFLNSYVLISPFSALGRAHVDFQQRHFHYIADRRGQLVLCPPRDWVRHARRVFSVRAV